MGNTTAKLFHILTTEINKLAEEEIDKIISGDLILSLKVARSARAINKPNNIIDEVTLKELLSMLETATSRGDGLKTIDEVLTNRKELEQFARFIDVPVMKQHKVDDIRQNIIEATVGASLRSKAIQGDNSKI